LKLVSNILTTLSARIVLLALALVSSIVLARALGPEGRGLFALVVLLPDLAGTVALLGFDQANAVYAGLKPERRRALVWQSVAIAVVVGGSIAAACACFIALGAPGFQSLLRGPLWLYLLPLAMLPGGLIVQYWQAILRGMDRIFLLNVIDVGMKAASLVLLVAFIAWLRFDVAGAVWADVIATVGAVVVMVVVLRRAGAWGRPSFDWSLWRLTTRFAVPAHAGTLATYLNYRIDQLIIAAWLPPEQLGFYVIAVGLAERLWMPAGAVATALLPHLTNSPVRDPALSATVSRHVMVWTGITCLLVFALADIIVDLLYSSAFAPTIAPLRWLLPGIFSLSVGKVLVAEMFAREKVRYTVWASGAAALVNVAGNVLLMPHMGISGAALASSISYTFLSLVGTWYYLRETGLPWTVLVPRRGDLLGYRALWVRRKPLEALET
jgi:O-antigen/teichoic acid export membrane protein